MWIDIVSILFVCVAANHLGLVAAMEKTVGRKLPIVNCVKCSTFWVTLAYGCNDIAAYGTVAVVLAIAFLCSWMAVWLELAMGIVDQLYLKLYETIYTTDSDDMPSADRDESDTADAVPKL